MSFEEHEQIELAKLEWLKAAIAEADSDVAAGRVFELTESLIIAIKADGKSLLDDP